jgi:hypothetical protein
MTLYYLATVYSKYPRGIEAAFEDAARLAGRLLRTGIVVYSPIAHTHPIAIFSGIDPLDHSIWLDFDARMMRVCDAIIVAQMTGWRESYGVNHEIEFFRAAGKPVLYLDCRTLEISAEPEKEQ